jgi:Domain of unknown function (DUF4135)
MRGIKIIDVDAPTPKSLKSIENAFECFQKAVVSNFDILLSRINKDMEKIIRPAFLNDFENPKLMGITPTGSDLHNRGNQVLILEFTDQNNLWRTRKVVYKPTPVQADAMLFGDNERLNKIKGEYKGCPSFIEIMNSKLAPADQLPTYLIVPCEDEHGFYEVAHHYGYIQYLSREPTFVVKEGEDEGTAEKRFKEEVKTKVNSGEKYDYVLNDPSSEESERYTNQYSRHAGLCISLMLATGLIDSHHDNIIAKIVKKDGVLMLYRYLIDGEISFSLTERTINATSCCFASVSSVGSMRPPIDETCHKKQHVILILKGDKVDPIHMEREFVEEGIRLGFKVIIEQPVSIEQWFRNVREMNIFVRLLPAATPELESMYHKVLTACFDKEKSENLLKFDAEAEGYLYRDPMGVRFPLYMDPNRNFFFAEAEYLSLPTCYIRINEKKLYLSHGGICITPTRTQVEKFLKKEIQRKSPGISEEEIQEKMEKQYAIKLNQYFERRNPKENSEIFLTTTLSEDAEEKLSKICHNINKFISVLDIVLLDNISSPKPQPSNEDKCTMM